ncbi:alpha/beta fold hydrolase [Yinghuangia soli]|uniref:Alpha/beta hydrolase n=1 Tax=Yinghuangia soli TaxID=2908204 RepID=A0AA41U362_9ACTN|nr:alpha/beta hydrolase [Yinghuangia soli]MCF2531480.1 alpha/beta hydrolase [Yinghuangia soli]
MSDRETPSRRRIIGLSTATVAGATLLGTTGTAAADSAASADHGARRKPTVVLVHGAFADASSWNPIIPKLQRAGYPVRAVANPLRGLAHDAAHLASVLAAVTGPVVLAGHSYGGAVVSEAGATSPSVEALVYIAAFVPDAGEVLGELAGRYPGSELQPALDAIPAPGPDGTPGLDLYIKADRYHRVFADDVPASTVRVLAASQRPLSATAFSDHATTAAWRSVPSWVLVSTQDRGIAPELQRFQARRVGGATVEVRSSHLPMYSRPDAVVSLITAAARSVRA